MRRVRNGGEFLIEGFALRGSKHVVLNADVPHAATHLAAYAHACALPHVNFSWACAESEHDVGVPTVSNTLYSTTMRSLAMLKRMPGRSIPLYAGGVRD